MKFEITQGRKLLFLTLGISAILIIGSMLTHQTGVLGNMIIISVFIVAVPQFFLSYQLYKDIKEMEEKFPIFLRDMIESLRSGMPFHQAIITNSKIDYGRLSIEVKKMAHQISWGVPFNRVIDQFGYRVKKSKEMGMAIKIIRESYFSGGDVVSTLEAVADANLTLGEADKEKKSLLNQYVVLMYALAFLFVGMVVAINKLMLPIFQASAIPGGSDALGLVNPCNSCGGFSCNVCGSYAAISSNLFSIDPTTIGSYYTSLFFLMSIIVSFSSGLVAGQISENSLFAGLKHSLIMTFTTVGAFYILIYLKLLGV
ncbi:MAG: type II secretion system F family protein [Candidatus Aenigmatarchaeota archaeon]